MSKYNPIEVDTIVPDAEHSSLGQSLQVPSYTMADVPIASGSISMEETTQEHTWTQRLKESLHPIALVFFIFFRISPIFMYLFGSIILLLFTQSSRFILHFIILLLLVSADFWNLKNISGRLLVGLRWWNETNLKEGTNEFENVWVFESADPSRYINPIDSKVFWTLLYIQPVAWIILAIMAILKLELLYLIVVAISVFLSTTNAVAFTKCDKFGKANVVANNLFSRATGEVFSRLNPFA